MRRAALAAAIAATAILATCAPALALTLDHSWPGYGGTCWTGSGRR